VKNGKRPSPLPVSVREALEAIGATGKGRCWYCDVRLPEARRAIRDGWDVQRIDEQPVASIILVCPECLGASSNLAQSRRSDTVTRGRNGRARRILTLEPKRA
jgi:hypothetical protein